MDINVTRRELAYRILRKIPKGKVTTYGDLADILNTSPRVIGQYMKTNPDPDKVPCFKVVRSNGTIGGFSLGLAEKIKRLEKESIKVDKNTLRIINFEKHKVSKKFLKDLLDKIIRANT